MTASFKTIKKNIKLNIIQCYAPTNDSSEDTKDHFYGRLQAVLDKRKVKDVNILMGDFNAKIGADNTGYEEVMGLHALGEFNKNGEKFANICALNNMVIGGSIFAHKRIHKATWVSLDHTTENQIDHLCVSKKFRRSLQDVRVKRGADVATDHHLLVAKLKMKLKKNFTDTQAKRQKFNVGFLKDPKIQKDYMLKLTNKFQVLQELYDEETDLHTMWKGVKNALTLTCQEVLGPKKPQQKDWMTAGTMHKIKVRKQKKEALNISRTRATKVAAQAKYTKAHKEVKRSVRTDKQRYIDNLAEVAEQAAAKGNMKQLYDTTRKLTGKYSRQERPVKDKEGQVIMGLEQQLNRWTEHFEELLNRPAPASPPDIQAADVVLPIDCSKPTRDEIRRAILRTKSGKAAGPDDIPAEALKADTETTVEMLFPLFEKNMGGGGHTSRLERGLPH